MDGKLRSAGELRKRIENQRRRLGISNAPAWYRGLTRSRYELSPRLLRRGDPGRDTEINLYADFATKGSRFLSEEYDSWGTLSLMQHYGVPTRLLDWTTSIDAALFFAVFAEFDGPGIWILNPYELNRRSVEEAMIFDAADRVFYDYYSILRARADWPHKIPIAMAAPWTNDRIERQAGCFTVHGGDTRPLDQLCPKAVKLIGIPNAVAVEVRKQLICAGRDAFSFFPDLEGLARSLRDRYGLG